SVMSLALVATASAATAAGPGEDSALTYEHIELQARTNLLANDEGYNLPPGSSFNSISPDINENADVAFRVQYVADEDPTIGRPGVWFGGDGEGGIVHTGDVDWRIPGDPSVNDQ